MNIIVTGSNKGLGFFAVKNLLDSANAKLVKNVIMTFRNEERGKKAVKELLEKYKVDKSKLKFHVLDICDDKSISVFKKYVKEKFGKVQAIINNAGVAISISSTVFKEDTNLDTAKKTIGTNFYAVYKFTTEMYDLIDRSNGKIVNVSSVAGSFPWGDKLKKTFFACSSFKEIQKVTESFIAGVKNKKIEGDFASDYGFPCYGISKLAVNAWTKILAQKESKQSDNVCVVCCHPGFCSTDMTLNSKKGKSPDEGGKVFAWLALNCTKKEHNGKFLGEKGKKLSF